MIEATRDDDGDANLTVALFLGQVTWWCGPDDKTGMPRCAHEHAGKDWLVRADDEWADDLGISAKAARRSRLRLQHLGLIETLVAVDDGTRCTHLRRLYLPDEAVNKPSTICPETEVESSTSGQEHLPLQGKTHARASSSSLLREGREGASNNATTTKASRLPEPFVLTDPLRAWVQEHARGINVEDQHERFCDHWRAQPGQKGVKADWLATWRNWMRRAYEYAEERKPTQRNGQKPPLQAPIAADERQPWM